MTDRDKFLTETMGLCWHEQSEQFGVCGKCGNRLPGLGITCPDGGSKIQIKRDFDFSTWHGFGMLWEWAIKQDWWRGKKDSLVVSMLCRSGGVGDLLDKYISPSRFADAIYEFLRKQK